MSNLKEIIGDYDAFLNELFFMLEDIDLDVEKYEMDHICYRVKDLDTYASKKIELEKHGELLIESIVNGRNISTFKLTNPIEFKNRKVFLIELPAPKNNHAYENGLEHVEFVTKEPLQKIVDRYPQFAFETFGIHKKINADITLKLGKYCIRFHNQSLEEIIKLEKKGTHKK